MKNQSDKQVHDGDMLDVEQGTYFYLVCCDCALVHKVTRKRVSGNTAARLVFERDGRRTGQRRRRLFEKSIRENLIDSSMCFKRKGE